MQNAVYVLAATTRPVDVFDAEQHVPIILTREKPRYQAREDITDM